MASIDLKKFNRVLAIYMQLQARSWITAQQFADRYEVSVRTIYRDIKSLEDAGVPVYSEVGKGYALVDGYKMPPTLFTKDEALSFAAAERLMQKYVDAKMSFNFSSALFKMKAVLKGQEKQSVSILEDQMLMISTQRSANSIHNEVLTLLFDSISSKKKINISYTKPKTKNAEKRILEPIGVFHENEFWYFMAFCYLRNDYRQFRLDRVNKISVLDDDFEKEHQPLHFFIEEKKLVELPKQLVIIKVTEKYANYFHWERHHFGFVKEEFLNDHVLMYFETSMDLKYFTRWFLMFADFSNIIEPEFLKKEVSLLADSVFKNSRN